MTIPFNKPFLTGNETAYIKQAVASGKISGDGAFTQKCHQLLQQTYGFTKCLLTTSCTDALEMAALLANIQPGDEVIAPSYTFVSTVNPFVLRGAVIVFCDSRPDHPGIDEGKIEVLVTDKTKAIVVTHYAGIACDMDIVMDIANRHQLMVIEDAAHAIDSFYKNKPLGSIGNMSAFSFHETKNIIAGEGGMIVLNDQSLIERAEIVREKGTNRSKFFRGEVDKYSWVDVGSSFLPSDITAAFLYAQLENLSAIQQRRKNIWETYYNALLPLHEAGKVSLPVLPGYATNNGHIFYMVCQTGAGRDALISWMRSKGILAIFHYLPLHESIFFKHQYNGKPLPHATRYANQLIRLPLFYTLTPAEQQYIIEQVKGFYAVR